MTAGGLPYCSRCGQDLGGVSFRAACPGCGALLRPQPEFRPPPPWARAVDAPPPRDEPIAEDVPCLSCGYALRGLRPSGNCPECGAPVLQSVQGAWLRFAGPQFLAQLWNGAFWVECGLGARLAGVSGAMLCAVSGTKNGPLAVMLVCELCAVACSGYGWWLLTGEHVVMRTFRSRGWARWWMVAGNVLEASLFTTWAGLSASLAAMASAVLPVGPCFFVAAFVVAWLVSIVTGIVYLMRLADRMPDPWLARFARMQTWLVPLLMLGSPIFVRACSLLILVAWVTAYVLYFVLVDRCRTAFAGMARQAANRALYGGT